MRYGSLFSGVGGFDLAFDRAGMSCAWQVEIDPQARRVLAEHWPNVPRYEDVRTIGASDLAPVDVVCGGFPCQDLSVAGKGAGIHGARSGLFFDMARITNELRPAFLVWENVPGLLSAHNGRDFTTLLAAVDAIGYHGAWTMLDARWFGLAQRRRRIFGVFARNDIGAQRCAEILALSDRLSWRSGASRTPRATVAGTTAACAYPSSFDGQDAYLEVVVASNALGAPDSTVPPLKAQSGQSGKGDSAPLVAYNWQSGGDVRYSFGLPTMQAHQVPAVGVRRLTPTECERLQGFPDGWSAQLSDSARYRTLGNAVAVPVAEWIGRRINGGTPP